MRRRSRAVQGGGRRWRTTAVLFVVFSFTALHRPPPPSTAQSRDVILATTTSTRDAGLLDSLVPVFERQTRYTVKVIAVGSGQALAMGRRGDADLVLSHAPEAERALVDSGYLVRRRLVMHNEFLIVGPAGDPAGLRGLSDPVAAVRRIAERRAPLVSRGDQSRTHQREQLFWKRAGFSSIPRNDWYNESGQGMGAAPPPARRKQGFNPTDPAQSPQWPRQ